ncbi:MAG: type II secretion system F family protein [Candidatus Ozemobacteraceae bacterium]
MEQYLVETDMLAKQYTPPDEEEGGGRAGTPDDSAAEDDWVRESREHGGGGAKKVLANIGAIITPRGVAARIAENLAKADIPLKANEFVATQFLLTIIPLIIGLVFLKSFIIGAMLAATGYALPLLWVGYMKGSRIAAFNGQILDTLVTLSNGLKAGYSFLQAMEMVARESPAPMSIELRRVLKENSLGMNLEDALRGLNNRVESEDWDLVTTVVLIQRQVGGNLSEILEKIGFTIRQRMKIKGDIQTKTAQAKISGALVGLLPFGIGFMIFLINPGFIMKLFTFKQGAFHGYYVVILGLLWEALGMYIIMKIVDIEV